MHLTSRISLLRSIPLALLMPLAVTAFAQTGFQEAIGAESFEKGSSIRQLSNGDFIIAGETESYGLHERDMLLLRTDSNGHVLWSKSFGGPERETVNDVLPMPDGGFLMTSEKYQPNKQEGENLTLVKTDASGSLQWKKVYDEGGNETEAFSLQETHDKKYIAVGMVKNMAVISDAFFTMRSEDQYAYMLKVDASGNRVWARRFNYGSSQVSSTPTCVTVASDGSYLITGNITKQGKTDKKIEKPAQQVNTDEVRSMMLLKVKPNGSLLWAREIEGNNLTMGYSVIQRQDGGIMLAGNMNITSKNIEVLLVALDPKGNLEWAKTFGAPNFESVADIVQTPDGGFAVSAMTYSFGNNISDVLIFKTDAKGNLQWAKVFGGKNEEYPSKLILSGNHLVTVGCTASNGSESFDVLLMKTEMNGGNSCFGKAVTLTTTNYQPRMQWIEGARTEPVEQGIFPPNMKKPDASNILENRRETRTKKLCP